MPWNFDGGPFDWWAPNGASGSSFTNGPVGYLNTFYQHHFPAQVIPPGYADYLYPNDQSDRLLWYHDHAMGITRLNAYAGLATGYLIRDSVEAGLVANGICPPITVRIPCSSRTRSSSGRVATPIPARSGAPGDLWYPSVYDGRPRWDLTGSHPVLRPGVLRRHHAGQWHGYPVSRGGAEKIPVYGPERLQRQVSEVEAGLEDNLAAGEPTGRLHQSPGGAAVRPDRHRRGLFHDAGDLDRQNRANTLLLGCAERAEFIVDFSALSAGDQAPPVQRRPRALPQRRPANDYYPGIPPPRQATPGNGPNTRTIMEFRVIPRVGRADRYKPLVLPRPGSAQSAAGTRGPLCGT